jgi:hypothetical protein
MWKNLSLPALCRNLPDPYRNPHAVASVGISVLETAADVSQGQDQAMGARLNTEQQPDAEIS